MILHAVKSGTPVFPIKIDPHSAPPGDPQGRKLHSLWRMSKKESAVEFQKLQRRARI
jgi:hypothetical protein